MRFRSCPGFFSDVLYMLLSMIFTGFLVWGAVRLSVRDMPLEQQSYERWQIESLQRVSPPSVERMLLVESAGGSDE